MQKPLSIEVNAILNSTDEQSEEDAAEFKLAWEKYNKLDEWNNTNDNNLPSERLIKETRVREIETELEEMKRVRDIVDTPCVPAKPESQAAPVMGITKEQVLTAFDGFVTEINLKSAMEDKPNWIMDACMDKGAPGNRHRSSWDPVILAIAIRDRFGVQKSRLANAFHEHSFLRDWRDDWREKSDY